jgi:hypothetical protein
VLSSVPGCGSLPPPVIARNPDHCTTTAAPCFIDVTLNSACPKGICFDPDSMVVKGAYDKVKLVWRLPGGYRFCENDGIFFKYGGGGMFFDNGPTDDPHGNGNAGSGVNYRWMDRNRDAKVTKHPYSIRFHKADCRGDAFERDPEVVNDM